MRLLSLLVLAPLALSAQQGAAPAGGQPQSRIARIVVSPVQKVVVAGDSVRFRAEARDANNNVIPNVTFRWTRSGMARFEGQMREDGTLVSGSTGTLPITVVGIIPGEAPKVEQFDVRMVPGPAARIAISPTPSRLVPGQRIRLGAEVLSAKNDRRDDKVMWRSSAPAIARVNEVGVVTAVAAGRATITASVGAVQQAMAVQVLPSAVASLTVTPEVSDARTGDVIRFRAVAKDAAGKPIDGITPVWSFNPGQGMIDPDGAFVGYEAGAYTVTASLGNRAAEAVVTLAPRDVRRPLELVGRLPRSRFTTEEVWLHPNGKVAYLGSGGGGDVLYTIDISDPSKPVVADSIIANTRRVNDVMTTPDGRFLVFTREGASDRKNGVVFASLEDPLHPKVISEFTDGVTAGVHSSFIYKDARHGQHVFITNDGTGYVHVLNIDDPAHPREVGRWAPTDRPEAGRSLHDIDIQDGLLYGSWWNDGLIILDVGNGIRGGTPAKPVLVSQFKYDLNAMYRQTEVDGGAGFIRGTHTAWRHRNYVFIADEVFPANQPKGATATQAGRAWGRLQVVDISDITAPRAVAFYEPEYGGVHNVWVAGDSLYMGAYNAGFRVFDISGELRGDLRAQGREIGHFNTADMNGHVQGSAMTWGVVVRDGLAYVNDDNNGLWIVRIIPKTPVVP
ncbi:MAG: Ig-like domain-containing protein [Gemmatimonadetes bacterium]|nr:Ig-like domain-containing protein [Gemmatimonadota bacterium]